MPSFKNKQKKIHKKSKRLGSLRRKGIREYTGDYVHSDSDQEQPLEQQNTNEEVFIVSDEPKLCSSATVTREQLMTATYSQCVTANPTLDLGDTESLGFFIDSNITSSSTDIKPIYYDDTPAVKSTGNKPTNKASKKDKKRKIIKDESIYLGSSDDDDDHISISSSEDIEILSALSHWAEVDMRQKERSEDEIEDIDMLKAVLFEDVCTNQVESDDEDIDLDEDDVFDLDQVPDALRASYMKMIHQERNEIKKEYERAKRQQQSRKPKMKRQSFMDHVLKELIQRSDIASLHLYHTTPYGRTSVIPKIAKIFRLETESEGTTVLLRKTANSLTSLKEYTGNKKNKKPVVLKSKVQKRSTKNDLMHGKMVASDAQPISSNNIGHRMLSAMGWKEGDSIGGGIKEPIKAVVRAKRRGLGA
ncbi:hypothetical protein BCV72DRAFT_263152 [Rhizopus microsporus var. microsporus]|nr:hypothetical protein BCV72DRAFT_263152 [Rhizopus microsporus var. microsporus]